MKKFIFIIVFFSLANLALAESKLANKVFIKGNQLFVIDNDQSEAKPYIIKGVTWSPETSAPDFGPNPACLSENVEYGFFFDWPNRQPQGHEIFVYWKESQFIEHYKTDIALMEQLNVNTIRVYSSFGDDSKEYTVILDELLANGIKVIMNVAMSKEDIDSQRYLKVVKAYKHHPAILLWAIGNEWNLDYNKYWGYETLVEAAIATNRVAKDIKTIDSDHPVTSILGDRFKDSEIENTVAYILKICSEVDIWGFNIYRGKSFGDFFFQINQLTKKPYYICEFGTDSFRTTKFNIVNEYQADDCQGWEYEALQAEFILGLWAEIKANLSAFDPAKQCLGGVVHEFNDSLWKVGSYHVGLGGLIDYFSDERCAYKFYNTEGFYLPGSHPDDVANEEYFGLVDAQRRPKQAFFKLQQCYQQLN